MGKVYFKIPKKNLDGIHESVVTSVEVTSPGDGYTITDFDDDVPGMTVTNCTITDAAGGTGLELLAIIQNKHGNGEGPVTSIKVVNGGTGHNGTPTFTVAGGNGLAYTVHMGDGILAGDEFDYILTYQDGKDHENKHST